MNKKINARSCLLAVLGAIALLALLVYLAIPYSPRSATELHGRYVLDSELVAEELTLFPDGTFTQVTTIKSTSEVIRSKGNWTYDLHTTRGLVFGNVTLDSYVTVLARPEVLKADYARSKPGIAVQPAEYWFGRIIIGRVDDWPELKKVE